MILSFIATVFNEETNIVNLLNSLDAQSVKPDEVVIVDAASSDHTASLIKNFQKTSQLKIRLIIQKCNRAQGRNLAIKESQGEVICVSDAGCVPDPDWLAKISQPILSRRADAVAGFYRIKSSTRFARCAAPFLGTLPHDLNRKTFLPSSRSIAFTKKAWAKVGGYPEKYDFIEDLIFAQKLKTHPRLKMITEPQAVVEWTASTNFNQFFHAISMYTLGNLESGYLPHLRKNALVVIRYALALPFILAVLISSDPILTTILGLLILTYLLYPSLKFRRLITSPADMIYMAGLQITADIAILLAIVINRKK